MSFPDMKTCSGCNKSKPRTADAFTRFCRSKDGLAPLCKPCESLRKKKRYVENKEKIQEQAKESRLRHIEQRREDCRNHYAAMMVDPDKAARELARNKARAAEQKVRIKVDSDFRNRKRVSGRESERRRRQNPELLALQNEARRKDRMLNPEKYRAREVEYHLKHPEKLRAKNAKSRSKREQAPGSFSGQDLKVILIKQDFKCFYCSTAVKNGSRAWHADHFIPISRGGTNFADNIVIACAACNLRKQALMPHEFMPERFMLLPASSASH